MLNVKSELKKLNTNQLAIINVLLKNGDLSKNEIAKKLDMKLTSLNNILYPMRLKGIIIETMYGQSNGGRRPILYSIPENEFFVIGIDISIMYTMVVLADIKMNVIYEEKFIMDESYTCEKTIETISKIILKIQSMYDPNDTKILGIGLGTIGPIVRVEENELIQNKDFFASGWENKNLKEMLESKTKKQIIWVNGVNAAILLEYLYGSGKEHDNVGYFNCGFGIRVGAISSNRIIYSMNNEEESFSKMIFSYNDSTFQIGDYVTIKAINNNYIKQMGINHFKNKKEFDIFKIIAKEAECGNDIALKVIKNAAEIMAIGITDFIMLLNSDLIILGGPLIMNCPIFYDICISVIKKNITSKKVQFIKMGKYKDYAISLGAANMIIERLINK